MKYKIRELRIISNTINRDAGTPVIVSVDPAIPDTPAIPPDSSKDAVEFYVGVFVTDEKDRNFTENCFVISLPVTMNANELEENLKIEVDKFVIKNYGEIIPTP